MTKWLRRFGIGLGVLLGVLALGVGLAIAESRSRLAERSVVTDDAVTVPTDEAGLAEGFMVPRGSVLGVDPSPRMLEVAAGRVRPDVPNLAFAPGAAETLSYDAEFDVVVSFNALHWVADLGLALRWRPERFVGVDPFRGYERLPQIVRDIDAAMNVSYACK